METGLTPQPRDPNYEKRVRDSYSRQDFMRSLGARMTALSNGARVGRTEFGRKLSDLAFQRHLLFSQLLYQRRLQYSGTGEYAVAVR